jgi:hypothetical protein
MFAGICREIEEYISRTQKGGKYMKKIVTLLFTSLIVFLMFVGPGNVALAHETDGEEDGCGCPIVDLSVAEKNKIVAKLISNDEFKNKKIELLKKGYAWSGVSKIQVVQSIPELGSTIVVTVPFITEDGTPVVEVFVNGKFATETSPPPTEL